MSLVELSPARCLVAALCRHDEVMVSVDFEQGLLHDGSQHEDDGFGDLRTNLSMIINKQTFCFRQD
ncbi:MAG: hypothetical protein F6J89_33595 [Symploca sp. SIO1C4]|uniref:Uncharacterized protein n=1 Tax=Symploca sp. SIO1C4 TaxID=2607765 RepID=A0A6B3NKX6_9CYAN|nr:hypothetical protein [Symploca sp. SIO1C4]